MLRNKIFIAAAALICWGCAHNQEHLEHSEVSEHSEHEHDEHSDLIELPDEQAEHFGVEVDTVYPAPFATVLRASGVIERSAANTAEAVAPVAGTISYRGVNQGSTVGRGAVLAVVNPSAVSGGDANRAAKAAVDAARREVERLEPLYRDRLVTAATYNAAKAELERAEAEYSPAASSATVSSPIAGVVTSMLVADGSYVQAGQPVATVSSDTRLTLHAEVPADRYAELAGITDARIGDFTLSEHAGKKSGVSAENGYGCVYFTFNGDDLIAPGSGGEVYLLGAPRPGVLSVPLGAIVEQQGEYFLFTRCSPGHYKKHAVTLGASDGRRVEITSGLEPGEAVVTAGAITVRLAESSGAIPEGHSHNH